MMHQRNRDKGIKYCTVDGVIVLLRYAIEK